MHTRTKAQACWFRMNDELDTWRPHFLLNSNSLITIIEPICLYYKINLENKETYILINASRILETYIIINTSRILINWSKLAIARKKFSGIQHMRQNVEGVQLLRYKRKYIGRGKSRSSCTAFHWQVKCKTINDWLMQSGTTKRWVLRF